MFTATDSATPTTEFPSHEIRLPDQNEPNINTTITPRVLTILSSVLEKLVARNDRLAAGSSQQDVYNGMPSAPVGKSLEVFHGVRSPSISIIKYLERIYKYTKCSPSCFVVGYVYIDRLTHKFPDSLVVSLNVHRLLVTSIMVASKMIDDVHYNNAFFAKVGGVSNGELNRLELELLFLLDFGLLVNSRAFESYCFHLEKEMLLVNGSSQNIERPLILSDVGLGDDHVTEMSVENITDSLSPPSSGGLA